MIGVMADSSVLIDYFNDGNDEKSDVLQSLMDADIPVCICPVIYQEVLQGIRNETDFHYIKNELDKMQVLLCDFPEAEDLAVNLYRTLRKQGVTIRKSNDCLIAAHAILADVPLLFKDRDFDFICKHTELRAY